MPTLKIEEDGKTTLYEILEDDVSIGRGGANDVQVRDRRASKQHGRVRRVYGRWKYIDLESKNGTRVNGRYRNQRWLEAGDELRIGDLSIRFEAPEGAPPKAAVVPEAAVAPKAAVPPKAPAKAPAKPAAPAPKRRAAPVRSAPEGEEGGGRRAPRKRGLDSSVVVLLGGLGAVAFLALMFFLMNRPGVENNQVFIKAQELIVRDRDYAGAAAYARKHGKPGENGWNRLSESIERWERLATVEAEREARNQEADAWLKERLEKRVETTGFRPPRDRRLPEEEVAALLRTFLDEYGDTRAAMLILGTRVGEPLETYRRILREYASADADVAALLRELELETNPLAAGKRFGEAIAAYELEKRKQSLFLVPELYQTFAERADKRILQLREEANASFERDMAQVDRLLRDGETSEARGLLARMIDAYGIDRLVRDAEAKLEEL